MPVIGQVVEALVSRAADAAQCLRCPPTVLDVETALSELLQLRGVVDYLIADCERRLRHVAAVNAKEHFWDWAADFIGKRPTPTSTETDG